MTAVATIDFIVAGVNNSRSVSVIYGAGTPAANVYRLMQVTADEEVAENIGHCGRGIYGRVRLCEDSSAEGVAGCS